MADKYATRSWCAGLGGVSTPSNPTELVKDGELRYLNCSLIPTPSMQYVSNLYVLLKDIKKAEGTLLRSHPELISAALDCELSIGIDKTAYQSYDSRYGYSDPIYYDGIDYALSSSSVQYNLGHWVQGGTVEEEDVHNNVTTSRLIVLNSTIAIITTEYWDHNPADDSIPLADCYLEITYEDNSSQSPAVNYTLISCEPYGSPLNGKYKYRIVFEETHPHVRTNNKKIKDILVMYSLWGGA